MTAPPPLDLPDLNGLTALVIDYDNDSPEVLSAFFEACAAKVLIARSAVAGLAYLDTAPKLDAVVTDRAMPGMDGIELARRLRQRPMRKKLPVIAGDRLLRNVSKRRRLRWVAEKAGGHVQRGTLIGRLIRLGRPKGKRPTPEAVAAPQKERAFASLVTISDPSESHKARRFRVGSCYRLRAERVDVVFERGLEHKLSGALQTDLVLKRKTRRANMIATDYRGCHVRRRRRGTLGTGHT